MADSLLLQSNFAEHLLLETGDALDLEQDLIEPYDNEVFADSPVGYWKCDETSGTTVNDYSGNAHPIVRQGSVAQSATKVMPLSLRSYDFPAGSVNDHLDQNDATWQSPHAGSSGQMTVEAWINIDSLSTIRTMFWKGLTSNFEYSLAVLTTGALQFAVFTAAGGTAGTIDSSTGLIVTGTTYHVAGTWDRAGNSIKIYINGSQVGSTTTSADSSNGTAPFVFGFRDSVNDRVFDGRADYLALYSTALSGARILAHYEAGTATLGTMAGPLGGLTGTMSGTVPATVTGVLAASFGGLTGTAIGTTTVTVSGVLTGNLGGLTATLTGTISHSGTMVGNLGGLTASLVGTKTVNGQLVSLYGPFTATMLGSPLKIGVLVANFGSLNAVAYAVPFDPNVTIADLQYSLWDANLTTNVALGSLMAATLQPSPWRADLQDQLVSYGTMSAPLGTLTGTMTGTTI